MENISTHEVFISYRHEDYDLAALTEAYLGQLGYDVFWDMNLREEDLPNESFKPVLESNIQNCRDFILIITEHTFEKQRIFAKDDWIFHEIDLALRYNRHIVAFLADGVVLPAAEDLPEAIRTLKTDKEIYYFPIDRKKRNKEEIYSDLNKRLHAMPAFMVSQDQNLIGGGVYNANEALERERLRMQGENTLAFDMQVLDTILPKDGDRSYDVLDVGCAQGFVGYSRFADDRFTKVLGIDRNVDCIAFANKENRPLKYQYAQVDLESDDFEKHLELEMSRMRVEKFDIIFASLVLHFLKDPIECILRLRNYMKPHGYLIIRGSSDETKIANSDADTELIRRIISRTYALPGIADRKNGSKIYNWLQATGFEDIKIYSSMRDTSGMKPSEKINLFKESFGWRLDVVRNLEKENSSRYNGMEKDLKALERRFYNPSFWYCEYDYIGVGRF